MDPFVGHEDPFDSLESVKKTIDFFGKNKKLKKEPDLHQKRRNLENLKNPKYRSKEDFLKNSKVL